MRNSRWVRLLAYVTGSVNQELLLRNEYLAAENRILRTKFPAPEHPFAASWPKRNPEGKRIYAGLPKVHVASTPVLDGLHHEY